MITNKRYKKKILEKIEELKSDQDYYRRAIDAEARIAIEHGYIVKKHEDMTFVYRPDMTIPELIQGSIRHSEGVIDGLRLAIESLEREL